MEEAAEILDSPDCAVTNGGDKKEQIPKLLALAKEAERIFSDRIVKPDHREIFEELMRRILIEDLRADPFRDGLFGLLEDSALGGDVTGDALELQLAPVREQLVALVTARR